MILNGRVCGWRCVYRLLASQRALYEAVARHRGKVKAVQCQRVARGRCGKLAYGHAALRIEIA